MAETSQFVATFVLNCLWQVLLVAAAAALGAKLLRRTSSAHRHLMWLAALALCLALPLGSAWRLVGEVQSGHAVPSQQSGHVTARPPSSSLHLSFITKNHARPVNFTPLISLVFVGCYAAFILYRAAKLLASLRQTLRFYRSGFPRTLPAPLAAIADRCASSFSLKNVAILCSARATGPVTLSFARPVLILPERFFTAVREADFSSALCHEFAHVRRHDFLLNLLCEFASIPVSFHPAVMWIKQRVVLTRESACDESAAKQSAPGTYARSLLNLARTLHFAGSQEKPDWALGLFDANSLEERIMNLLCKTTRANAVSSTTFAALASILLAVTCLGASAFSLQVSHPRTAAADQRPFAGTWTAVYNGTTIMVLELRTENGKLAGGMRVCSFNINTEGGGQVIAVTDKTLVASLPARNFVVSGKSLWFDWKDPDGDEMHWKLELTAAGRGNLHWMQLPDGLKALPIPVTKDAPKSH